MTDETAAGLLAFWAAEGALTGDAARDRLSEVVCVARDDEGAIRGACSVQAAALHLVDHQRFWVFRRLLPGAAATQLLGLIAATYAALDGEFDGAPEAPIGLCLLLDEDERRLRPDALWSDPPMLYVGYLDDGRQARVGYFQDAVLDRRVRA